MAREKLTAEEALRRFWAAFCDADNIDPEIVDDPRGPLDAWIDAGLIELRPVTDDDLGHPFAYERGIIPDGEVWDLTDAGRQALAEEAET